MLAESVRRDLGGAEIMGFDCLIELIEGFGPVGALAGQTIDLTEAAKSLLFEGRFRQMIFDLCAESCRSEERTMSSSQLWRYERADRSRSVAVPEVGHSDKPASGVVCTSRAANSAARAAVRQRSARS
ncbi:MAG: hypothetical protein QOJ52_4034 [Acidimicrobiaceae bacterium]|nr:hypothetical protein [Acidimicrobiaceae bacterium]